MAKSDQYNDIQRWIHLFNKGHGYAGIFNSETKEEQRIIEIAAANEWCRSLANSCGVSIDRLESNPHDPPDCFVTINQSRLGVELAQLVEESHKSRVLKGETPYAGQLFSDMQWTESRLCKSINDLLVKKGNKYKCRQIIIDVLIIHTAEPWLSSEQVESWLPSLNIEAHPHIARAFLLLDYEPGRSTEYWPVFPLYGESLPSA